MKVRKLILISLALLTLSVLFSSCENEDRSGRLNFNTYNDELAPRTDKYGRFSLIFDLDINDVRGYSSYDYLSSIHMYDSFLSFETYGDYRDKGYLTLWLSTNYIKPYEFGFHFDGKGKVFIDTRDRVYERFMEELFREMADYGRVRLFIDVEAIKKEGYRDIPFQFMDFDIESDSRLRLLFNRY